MRPRTSACVQEPVAPYGAGLDPEARIVADLGSNSEGIGAKGIQLEAKLRPYIQCQVQIAQVSSGQVFRTRARRCGYLHQALHALGLETSRIEPFCLGCLPASPQEVIRQVAERPCPVNQKEFLLEPYPANRKAHAPLIRDVALRPHLR